MREMKCPHCGSKVFMRRLVYVDTIRIYDDGQALTDEVIKSIEQDYSLTCEQCKRDLTDTELATD